MPRLRVHTNNDAEVFIMDSTLNRVARSVGIYEGDLEPGLFKIRVIRAGTIKEQLIEVGAAPQDHSIFVDRFSAIAPIGPMLANSAPIEALAQAALADCVTPGILVLAHQSDASANRQQPFMGATIFPWRGTRFSVALDKVQRSAKVDGELWSAVAVPADPANGPFMLELVNGSRVSRQAVLVAEGWQTRIFLRGSPDGRGQGEAAFPTPDPDAAPFDVSIQMARPWASVVYYDHLVTVEVARNALERGRAIFTGANVVDELLHGKYENPIAGLTGLHLLLDAKVRSDAGDATYGLAATPWPLTVQGIADEVLVNLTRLLHPKRVAAMQDRPGQSLADLQQKLLYPDPDWPESADLTALRVRAGRCTTQVFIPSPPMFRVSWDVLKSHAGREGLTWIGRQLWSSTGAAGSAGPYLAWAPGQHSVKRTLQRISDQRPGSAQPWTVTKAGTVPDGAEGILSFDSAATMRDSPTLESMIAGGAENADQVELAISYGLPLSILEKAPRKRAKRSGRTSRNKAA